MRLLLLCFVLFVFPSTAIVACAPMEPRGSIAHPQVDQRVALAFAGAATALALADSAEAAWLDSLPQPTDAQLAQSSARVAKLAAVRDVLERIRQHLDGDVSSDLAQAIDDLKGLVASAQKLGVKIPSEAFTALNAVPAVLP